MRTARQVTPQSIQRVDSIGCLKLTVLRVEMRRQVIVVVHIDNYAKKLTDTRHMDLYAWSTSITERDQGSPSDTPKGIHCPCIIQHLSLRCNPNLGMIGHSGRPTFWRTRES